MLKYVGEFKHLEDLGFAYEEALGKYIYHMFNGFFVDISAETRMVSLHASYDKKSCYKLEMLGVLFEQDLLELV